MVSDWMDILGHHCLLMGLSTNPSVSLVEFHRHWHCGVSLGIKCLCHFVSLCHSFSTTGQKGEVCRLCTGKGAGEPGPPGPPGQPGFPGNNTCSIKKNVHIEMYCVRASRVAQRSKALHRSARGDTTYPAWITGCTTTGWARESHRAAHNWPSFG